VSATYKSRGGSVRALEDTDAHLFPESMRGLLARARSQPSTLGPRHQSSGLPYSPCNTKPCGTGDDPADVRKRLSIYSSWKRNDHGRRSGGSHPHEPQITRGPGLVVQISIAADRNRDSHWREAPWDCCRPLQFLPARLKGVECLRIGCLRRGPANGTVFARGG
jgi:hypothetical protein